MYSLDEGRAAVRAARAAVEMRVTGNPHSPAPLPETFSKKGCVFVTLKVHSTDELRGCIGYHQPYFPLKEAVVRAAESAAMDDPRFPPVTADELPLLRIEVSLLTPPEPVSADDPTSLPEMIRVGTDGLIASRESRAGLLLPQVPVEWGWDAREFLSQTCVKAGLPPDAWLDGETAIERFQAEVFEEVEPRGEVVRRGLEASHACH
jgi:uncharacterized protein (TIGR00296 family)